MSRTDRWRWKNSSFFDFQVCLLMEWLSCGHFCPHTPHVCCNVLPWLVSGHFHTHHRNYLLVEENLRSLWSSHTMAAKSPLLLNVMFRLSFIISIKIPWHLVLFCLTVMQLLVNLHHQMESLIDLQNVQD